MPDYTALAAKWRAEFPYVLNYTRRGGSGIAIGFVAGGKVARSCDDAERLQRQMEMTDAQYGHVTTYSIELRAGCSDTKEA